MKRPALLAAAIPVAALPVLGLGGQTASAPRVHRRPPARVPFRGGPGTDRRDGRDDGGAGRAHGNPPGRRPGARHRRIGRRRHRARCTTPPRCPSPEGPPLLEVRAGSHSATLLPDGRVLVAGDGATARRWPRRKLYDPAANRFFPGPRMTTPRAEHTATLLSDGRVLMAAGVAAGYDRPFLSSAEIYDPAAGDFRATNRLITPRRAHIANRLPDGRVLITGGSSARGSVLSSAEAWDPVTESFQPAGALASAAIQACRGDAAGRARPRPRGLGRERRPRPLRLDGDLRPRVERVSPRRS